MTFVDKVAIAGIGATEFSKQSGRSELRLAIEATTAALADAGIEPEDVDGLVSFNMDNNDPSSVARNLGAKEVRFFCLSPNGGGGACGNVTLAALAVASGQADVVVCYRAMNERSEQRYGRPMAAVTPGSLARSLDLDWSLGQPYGCATPAGMIAMIYRRYMHEYNYTSEDFGHVTVAARELAATNPYAWFYEKPITLEDHQSSRLISDPLRLLDCCQESDGGVALVLTSVERARSLRQPPAVIKGGALGAGHGHLEMGSYYEPHMAESSETGVVADQLWRQSGLGPEDIDVAMFYDHFTPAVLMSLEECGFCGRGEAADFIREAGIGFDGKLPVNTNGGQLGEGYIHGYNGIAEAVRQVRGTAVNQVADVEYVLATSGAHVPTSGLILGRA